MSEQNLKGIVKGMEQLGATNIEAFENGITFKFQGKERNASYGECMIYIMDGI